MKTIEKTITVWVADDGKEFEYKHQCLSYINHKTFELKRIEFLSQVLKEEFKSNFPDLHDVIDKLEFRPNITGDTIIIHEDYGEFEEDFDGWFARELYEKVKENMRIKYGFNLYFPSYYWSK